MQVLAVEWNEERLRLLTHNAGLYDVAHKIVPVCADFFAIAHLLQVCKPLCLFWQEMSEVHCMHDQLLKQPRCLLDRSLHIGRLLSLVPYQ